MLRSFLSAAKANLRIKTNEGRYTMKTLEAFKVEDEALFAFELSLTLVR